jgi:hypothetical protein
MDVRILNEIMEGRDPFLTKDTGTQVPPVEGFPVGSADVSLSAPKSLRVQKDGVDSTGTVGDEEQAPK